MSSAKRNAFLERIVQGVQTQERYRDPHLEGTATGWHHRRREGRCSPAAMLQGMRMIAEVSDHGALLVPPGRTERLAVDVVPSGAGADSPTSGRRSLEPGDAVFEPGEALLDPGDALLEPGRLLRQYEGVRTTWRVHPDEAALLVEWDPARSSAARPWKVRLAAPAMVTSVDGLVRAATPDHPQPHADLNHNNSRVPDPPPPPSAHRWDLFFGWMVPSPGNAQPAPALTAATVVGQSTALLVDWPVACVDMDLGVPPAGACALVVLAAADATSARAAMARINLGGNADEELQLTIDVPEPDVRRQLGFAVANSLACRTVHDSADRDSGDMFVHGRRDHGYADTGHLHQSYMLYLPALAAGAEASVASDISAYLVLQREDGAIMRAPRPGSGSHPYVGTYTNAHMPLAVHRYVSWTGDAAFLETPCAGSTVWQRTLLAGEWLWHQRAQGLIAPCGWLDAWNPDVIAQGQVSAAAVLAFEAMASLAKAQAPDVAATWRDRAESVRSAMTRLLLDPDSGIVAENLLANGQCEGGRVEDFFAHTQIWAQMAGVGDRRALALIADDATDGVRIVRPTAFDRSYFAASTDGDESLDLDSTRTWLLARWPEVTHLFCQALAAVDQPDRALAIATSQLPTTRHRRRSQCPPHYYPEKYLEPGDQPWLCTWSGDPSLVELVLTGFFGIQPELHGLRVDPRWPSTWRGRRASARFWYRGAPWTVIVDPRLPAGTVRIAAQENRFGDVVDAAAAAPDSSGRVIRMSDRADR